MRALMKGEYGMVGGMRELAAEEVDQVVGGVPVLGALVWLGEVIAGTMVGQYVVDSIAGGSPYTKAVDDSANRFAERASPGDITQSNY